MSAADTAAPRVVLGRITGVFGIKGWVKVESYTEPLESILTFTPWHLRWPRSSQAVRVREGQRHGRAVIARIEGIDDRTAAEALAGAEISVERAALPALKEREFYRADLLGMTVRDMAGAELGRVDHFVDTAAHPMMVVRGDTELWVPALPPHLRRVDLVKREVVVAWPPPEAPEELEQEP